MSQVKVSVIIPIYNVGNYIEECIRSVVEQTLRDIEVICVDDASTDNSLSIARKFEKEDDRVKVIAYQENKSASQARKDGVELAQGEYILFLDGDDSLKENACEELYSIAQKKKVDVLHFGTDVINYGNADVQRIENLYKLLKPYNKLLKGKDVFQSCFVEKKYRFTLWNKMYTTELCKKAFLHIEDGNFPKAQDLYAFFVLCFYAQSYYGVNQKYYNYRFGAGITGKKKITLAQCERFCMSEWTARAVQTFADSVAEEQVQEIAKQIRYDLLGDCVNNWYNFLPVDEQAAGFDLLAKYWKPAELSGKLCERFFGKHYQLADAINGANTMKLVTREVKTIGVFYYRLTMGGVQRVISLLVPMFLKMGYKVVFFMEEKADEEYELPDEVTKVMLPPSFKIKKVDYIKRGIALEAALKEHQIDLMIYNASSSTKLLFELIILKMLKIPTILTVHEVAFQCMLNFDREMVNRPSVFRLADEVAVLSKVEETYWRLLGVNACYVPNPITNEIIERRPEDIEKNTIVWVGRLDERTKRYADTIDAMRMVVPEVPDAKLFIVGNEVTEGAMKQLKKKIVRWNLQNNVILCGATNNVDSYYRKAAVHLLTSVSETFPMTIIESKSYGIPLVMYDLPFLEIIKSGKGVISVPQENKTKLANALVELLKDDSYREKMGRDAKESLQDFLEYDLESAWERLINFSTQLDKISSSENENYQLMMQSLLYHYGEGWKRNHKMMKRYEKIESSKDYKIGKFLLKYPKRIYYKFLNLHKK